MVRGYVKPNKISYRLYQYDKQFEYKNNSYRLTLQACLGLFTELRFKRNYEVDFTTLKEFKEPTPFGKKWKGWYFQFLGLGCMFRKQIK